MSSVPTEQAFTLLMAVDTYSTVLEVPFTVRVESSFQHTTVEVTNQAGTDGLACSVTSVER